jgi:PEGA domain-containing protein
MVSPTRALALIALFAAAPAGADKTADAQAEREAKTLFAEGNRLLAAGDAAGALGMYRSAYDRFANPKLLLNIGTALRQLGRNAEAAEAYEQYLRESGFDAKKAAEVTRILGELEPLVGRARVETTPPGARVSIDGRSIGAVSQPRVVRVEPGNHTLAAELQGYEPANVAMTIAAGEEKAVPIALAPLPQAPTPPPEPQARWPEPSPEVRVEVQPAAPPSELGHAGHLGVVARSETDLRTVGTGSALGATLGLGRLVEVSALALLQRDTGMRVSATAWLLPDAAVKPFLRLGVPVFFGDGASAGIHAGAGLVWDVTARYGVELDGALEHFPGAPGDRYKTAGVLGAGLHVRVY